MAENLEAKRGALAAAQSSLTDDGLIVTTTSSLPVQELAAGLADPGRFAAWHWFYPADLMALVEIVPAERTSDATVERLRRWSRQLGKQPIVLHRDAPGFIANRLQYALLREAWALVRDGVCAFEDVDLAVTAGLGARWAAIGPFAAMDLAGLDVHAAVCEQLFPALEAGSEVPPALSELRSAGAAGAKGGAGILGAYSAGAGRRTGAAARPHAHRPGPRASSGAGAMTDERAVCPRRRAAVGRDGRRDRRRAARVALGAAARARMTSTREVIERAIDARRSDLRRDPRASGRSRRWRWPTTSSWRSTGRCSISHNVGHGPLAPAPFVRAAMVVRAAGLALGYAGVRPLVVDALCAALNAGVTPRLHTMGSVGQADLSQMAEIGLALSGQTIAPEELRRAGLEPLVFGPREAHAILNANAYSTGVACLALQAARGTHGTRWTSAPRSPTRRSSATSMPCTPRWPGPGRTRDSRSPPNGCGPCWRAGRWPNGVTAASQPPGRALLQGAGADAWLGP